MTKLLLGLEKKKKSTHQKLCVRIVLRRNRYVVEKIVDGKLNKFYSENCLLQQEFVKDGDLTVEKYIASAAKALGGTVTFRDAVRFEKGEGIEKKQENFAEEIAKQLAK